MENGSIKKAGDTADTIREYLATGAERSGESLDGSEGRLGVGDARFWEIRMEDLEGAPTGNLASGHGVRFVLAVRSRRVMKDVRVRLFLSSTLNHRVATFDSLYSGGGVDDLPQDGELVCTVPRVHLAPGRYRVELMLECESSLQDHVTEAGHVDVEEGDFFGSGRPLGMGFQIALTDFSWHVRPVHSLVT
jgi:lipopolysaccharide transport system ATP-binding protein